jgi:superfamily II DNA or RNA helicase
MTLALSRKKKRSAKVPRLSRLKKPAGMPLEEWQIALRRQFGREQKFKIKNVGDHRIFSTFEVYNPESKNAYRVAIRGTEPGDNYCSCADFATNTLGTCKHIECTLAKLQRQPGGKGALRAGFQPPYSEVYLQYGSQRTVRFHPGSNCPPQLARLAAKYFGADGELLPEAFHRFEQFVSEAGRPRRGEHELRCYQDALAFVAEVRDAERRREDLAKAFPRGIKSPGFDHLVSSPLYDYQREGALFAACAGRCLIGDEMGLGKTIQALAAAEIMAKHFGVERALIVCPTSLKHQWEREIGKFTKRTAQVIGGLRARRQQLFAEPSFYKITNYDTVHADLDLIDNWSPDLVILDEAQRIKNWTTRAARYVKKINSPHAIVLTGTPLENRLEELVSIIQFVDRYRLGPTFRLLHEHQMRDESGKVAGYRNLNRLGESLAPILIRRRKDEVLKQLPERLDKNFFVPMTDEQRRHHEENKEIVARIAQKWQRYKFLSEADQRRLMIALQNMRMSCDSSYLLDQEFDHGVKADELVTLLEEVFEERGAKVVIFSQWLRMHELLVRRLRKKGWEHVLFHGGVPGPKRKGLVERFRDRPECRAFLATDAGGVGLNLQCASVVVNMDLPWNPAVLEQRIGRVHRLGQSRPVRVVNFVAQGTIEEGMLGVLKFKKSLFAGVLDGGEAEVFLGGSRLKRFMDTVQKATTAIPDAAPAEEPATPASPPIRPSPSEREAAPAGDPWTGLVESGMALLTQLARASQPTSAQTASGRTATGAIRNFIVHDERTGASYLKLPVPKPEALTGALQALGALLGSLREGAARQPG